MLRRPPRSTRTDTLFPYTTLSRSRRSPIREWREIGALAARIEALVRDWQPDLLHAHSPVLGGLAALRVGKRLGIPVLYEIRAFWEDAAVGNGTRSEERRVGKECVSTCRSRWSPYP